MIPTFNDKEGYTFKGYREDLENEDAEIKEGKQGSKENKTYNGIYERKAAELVMEKINNPEMENQIVVLKTTMRCRESTGE